MPTKEEKALRNREAQRRWVAKNRQTQLHRVREHRADNLEACREASRRSHAAYRPTRLLAMRDWQRRNPEKCRASTARRKAQKLQATLGNSDTAKTDEVYAACPEGYEVDHIIPLQGENVCGLHVSWNLQYLTPGDNIRKSNVFDFTYDNNTWRSR